MVIRGVMGESVAPRRLSPPVVVKAGKSVTLRHATATSIKTKSVEIERSLEPIPRSLKNKQEIDDFTPNETQNK
jgi:hypothetical protein